MKHQNIYDCITAEETAYQTTPIQVFEGYEWSMFEHIKLSILYKNSQLATGKDDNKPVKNIVRPILNLQHRAEGFDVKDIELFVDSPKDYYKSFLLRKYHDKWARENGLDTFIDEMVESYVDFGGALIKKTKGPRPEVVPFARIAFCDQTDILSGPICEKHNYSPDQLKEMEKNGWKKVDEAIVLSDSYKLSNDGSKKQIKTPGRYIEVYEVHGAFPAWWLQDGEEEYEHGEDEGDYVPQVHICTFYTDEHEVKRGLTLFKGKEKDSPYKFIKRTPCEYGRALGTGGAEELFESQVWTNYGMIRMKEMLDSASKQLFQTADVAFARRNQTNDLDSGEILITEQGTSIQPIQTSPFNIQAFENSVTQWETHARMTGGAQEAIMGDSPASGTPFKLQELVTAEAHSLHEYRKGKIATFTDEIYRDWLIPMFIKDISEGTTFLATLDMGELESLVEQVVINETNKMLKEKILNGENIYQKMTEAFEMDIKTRFLKEGSKKFIEIFKGEFQDSPIDVYTNIVGKQKDLSKMTDKLTNVFRQVLSMYDPASKTFPALDDPRIRKTLNEIFEYSGLSPISMGFLSQPKPQQPPPTANQDLISPSPEQAMGQMQQKGQMQIPQ